MTRLARSRLPFSNCMLSGIMYHYVVLLSLHRVCVCVWCVVCVCVCVVCGQADRLQSAMVEVEQKERRLVTQCLEQFAEARGRLSDLREREELTSSKNMELQVC